MYVLDFMLKSVFTHAYNLKIDEYHPEIHYIIPLAVDIILKKCLTNLVGNSNLSIIMYNWLVVPARKWSKKF